MFACALALRCLHLWLLRGDPWLELPLGDAAAFDQWARRIASGQAPTSWYQAPLYPYWLAGLYRLGLGAEGARFVQAALGAGACVLIADATRRWCGLRVGSLAGLILAIYAPSLYYESLLLKCALASFCFALALWLWARRASLGDGRARQLAWGLAFGLTLAALVSAREHAWVLVPISLGALLAGGGERERQARAGASSGNRRGAGSGASGESRRGAKRDAARAAPGGDARAQARAGAGLPASAGLLLGLGLGLAPIGLHNWRQSGELALGSGNLGPNLYIGNHEGADGLYTTLIAGRGQVAAERRDTMRLAEAESGRSLTAGEVSAFWRGRALEWIRARPWQAARLYLRKLRLALHAREWMDSQSYVVHEEHSRLVRGLDWIANFGLLFVFALHGLACWFARAREQRSWRPRGELPPSLGLFALALLAGLAAFFVLGRFRLALLPFLAPLAARGLLDLLARARAGDARRLARPLAWLLPAALLSFGPIAAEEHPVADSYNNLGSALLEAGRRGEAERAFERAIEAWPEGADAHFNRGRLWAREGREEEARRELLAAAELEPSYLADACVELARLRQADGDLEGARALLLRAIEADPEAAGPLLQLGSVLRRSGLLAQAEVAYRRSLALDPTLAATHNDLGYLLAGTGREAEAAALYRRALELQPELEPAVANLGWLLASATDSGLRDAEAALELADRLAELQGAASPHADELRAEALASASRFPAAAAAARRAASLARAGADAETAQRCEARAEAYERGRPWSAPRD